MLPCFDLPGVGAAGFGGRWNPRGIKAVYASFDPVTATKESYQNFSEYGIGKQMIRPRVFVGAKVVLQRVFDLGDRRIRRKIGFTLEELIAEDWHAIQAGGEESWTQAIGRGCKKVSFEALIAPSARDQPSGMNLVVFPDRMMPGSKIELMGKEDLPEHPGIR